MLRRTGTSGEGMQQNRSRGRNAGRKPRIRTTLVHAAIGATFVGLVIGFEMSVAQCQTSGSDTVVDPGAWDRMLQRLGLKQPVGSDSAINYTERSPLVVPPTRDLPPPVASGALPAADWPQDAKKQPKHTKGKTALVPDTAVQTPNPPFVRKPWYDPSGWFTKEEYANFAGEPVRQSLTDPPAGYRVPSPDEPYGISPDKKSGPKTGGDGTRIQTGTQAATQAAAPATTQTPPPTAPQSVAPPQPSTATQPGPPLAIQPEVAGGK
jgi:hypothetical protein